MNEGNCGLRMFPDLPDDSTDLSVVDRLLIVISGRIEPLQLLISIHNSRLIFHKMTS